MDIDANPFYELGPKGNGSTQASERDAARLLHIDLIKGTMQGAHVNTAHLSLGSKTYVART